MKNNKMLALLSLVLAISFSYESIAQVTLSYPIRKQYLNQYTSVFICSPNNGTVIQNIHNDDIQTAVSNSDRFYEYNNGYVGIEHEPPAQNIMQPGRGYVLQLGGNGTISQTIVEELDFNFVGGSANNGFIATNVNSGFNLLGNPYSNFLDLDLFLLNSNNRTKVKGPIMLWSHNTILSNANINPNDSNYYTNSANDFALYNVLGGVAAGREISTSAESGTSTGIQTPNGKICFGTGFGIYATTSGQVNYDNTMRTGTNNDLGAQSFRLTNDVSQNEIDPKGDSNKLALLVPSVRSRIWLNIERGIPPTSGNNTNPLKQILIGYSPCFGSDCATTGDSDRVFDAETVTAQSNPSIDFYSFAAGSTKKLAIQGRGDFQNNDFFQLGYKATDAGTYTITATADGMFSTKPYYILDADDPSGEYHVLPYRFTTISGTNNTRFKVVFENLISITSPQNICDSQISDIDNVVYSTIVSGATTYKFRVRKDSDTGPVLGEYNGQNPTYPYVFNLNLLGIAFNTPYWVSVATYKIGGEWQYGPQCKITTPALTKTRKLEPCGIILPATINNTWRTLYVTNVPIVGIPVQKYKFYAKIGNTTFGNPFETTNNSCNLWSFGAPLTTNTTYSIAVQLYWNNAWQDIGSYCDVITSSVIPRYSHNNNSIFEATTYPNPFENSFKLEINTSSEETVQVNVYDMLGRQIESRQIKNADLGSQEIGEDYTSGVYNLIVKQNDNIKTLRIIKR